ncbi:SANT/Myb_domain [Hexamita inflata]|uniref:SANT/Myb domain n=1 Tax=Hexamita inflata TaxID=28002 RepID=A0AA86RDZ5_9EUKA|nr:SANT/Myb domain [Hexamita inflata]
MNSQLYQIALLLQIGDIQAEITKIKQEITLRRTRTDHLQTNSKRSRWSQHDDQQLVTQVKLLGIHNYQEISQKIPNKTASQVYFRLRYLKGVFLQEKEVYQNKTDLKWFGEFGVNK